MEIVQREQKPVENMVTRAKAYNKEFDNIPEHYKTFQPAPGMVLVKLRLNEEMQSLATGRRIENTDKFETASLCYYSHGNHMNGYGVIVAGNNVGSEVMVRPNAFFFGVEGVGFVLSDQYVFETPKHTEKGYFLIPANFILGTY